MEVLSGWVLPNELMVCEIHQRKDKLFGPFQSDQSDFYVIKQIYRYIKQLSLFEICLAEYSLLPCLASFYSFSI